MTRITKSITIAALALALASQGTPSASSNGVAAYQNKGASYGGHMAQHKRMLRRSERSRRHNGASSDDGSASQKVTMPLEQYDSNGKDETKHTPKDAPSSPGKKDEDCDKSSTLASGSKSTATPLVSDSAAKVKETVSQKADSSDSKDDATNSDSKDDADGADDSSTNKATTKPTSLSYGQHKASKTGVASDENCDGNCDEEGESADNDDDEEDCDDEEDDSTSSDSANASTSADRSKATKSSGSKKSNSNDSDDSDSKSDAKSDASSSFSSSQAISTPKVQAAKEESPDSGSGSASKSASLSSRGSGSSLTNVIKTITGGFATFFYQGGNAGACGTVHSDSDKVVALHTRMYANGAHCGKKVMLKNKSNGKTSEATVADECPTCKNTHSVDLSKAAFDALSEESVGMFNLEWGFLSS